MYIGEINFRVTDSNRICEDYEDLETIQKHSRCEDALDELDLCNGILTKWTIPQKHKPKHCLLEIDDFGENHCFWNPEEHGKPNKDSYAICHIKNGKYILEFSLHN